MKKLKCHHLFYDVYEQPCECLTRVHFPTPKTVQTAKSSDKNLFYNSLISYRTIKYQVLYTCIIKVASWVPPQSTLLKYKVRTKSFLLRCQHHGALLKTHIFWKKLSGMRELKVLEKKIIWNWGKRVTRWNAECVKQQLADKLLKEKSDVGILQDQFLCKSISLQS